MADLRVGSGPGKTVRCPRVRNRKGVESCVGSTASARRPLAANGRYFGYCRWFRWCRIPGSASLADVHACWLRDGRSHSQHQRPTRRGDPRSGPLLHPRPHPSGNQLRLRPKTLCPPSPREPKPRASNSFFILLPLSQELTNYLDDKQMNPKKIPCPRQLSTNLSAKSSLLLTTVRCHLADRGTDGL